MAEPKAGEEQWPRVGETQEEFLDRCSAGLIAGGMGKEKADSVCDAKWEAAKTQGKRPAKSIEERLRIERWQRIKAAALRRLG